MALSTDDTSAAESNRLQRNCRAGLSETAGRGVIRRTDNAVPPLVGAVRPAARRGHRHFFSDGAVNQVSSMRKLPDVSSGMGFLFEDSNDCTPVSGKRSRTLWRNTAHAG